MLGHSESGGAYVVASLSYKRRQRRIILAKVNGVQLDFLVDLGIDSTVVEQPVAKQLKLRINPNVHNTCSIGNKLVNIIGSATAQFSLERHEWKEYIFEAKKFCNPALLGSSELHNLIR